jgi:choline kinase
MSIPWLGDVEVEVEEIQIEVEDEVRELPVKIRNVFILCAGKGSRIGAPEGRPKCLFDLYKGQTPLGRALDSLLRVGITDITVVVSSFPHQFYKKNSEAIENFVRKYKRFNSVKIKRVMFPQFNTEILWTFFSCRKEFSNTFVLLGDVIFAHGALQQILTEPFKKLMFVGSKKEIFGLMMNEVGSEILRYFPNPFHNRVSPDEPTLWKIGKMWHLFWGLDINNTKFFEPSDFMMDIDIPQDYKRVCQIVRDWKI